MDDTIEIRKVDPLPIPTPPHVLALCAFISLGWHLVPIACLKHFCILQSRGLTAAEQGIFLPSELKQYQADHFSSLLAIPTEPLPLQCEWA